MVLLVFPEKHLIRNGPILGGPTTVSSVLELLSCPRSSKDTPLFVVIIGDGGDKI